MTSDTPYTASHGADPIPAETVGSKAPGSAGGRPATGRCRSQAGGPGQRAPLVALACSIALLVGCSPEGPGPSGGSGEPTAAASSPMRTPAPSGAGSSASPAAGSSQGPGFEDVQGVAELAFTHVSGASGEHYMPETLTGGGGWLDYDGDGWQDIYLVQSGPMPGYPDQTPLPNRLFRNDGDGTFTDVTETSGAGDTGYGVGMCAGDVDNDGTVDLHITNFGPDELYRNNGDGTFVRATGDAGIDNPRWGSSCAFADFDQDGWLDLYVVNYVNFTLDTHIRCGSPEVPSYCHPDNYDGVPDILYRNRGDGTFEDVTEAAGVRVDDPEQSKGLGVVWFDFDDDGDQDIYVANDSTRNFLYRNEGDGTFTDVGLRSGTAFNLRGVTEASMGIAAGDFDGDGLLDLFTTHLGFETNTHYRNRGDGTFDDATERAGLAAPSITKVGFGTILLDHDHDGDNDLYVGNGHIRDNIALTTSSMTYPQQDQLFENDGTGTFREVTDAAGPALSHVGVSRAVATADFDQDGDLDLLVTQIDAPARLLRNDVPKRGASIQLDLRLATGAPAVGARVTVSADDARWVREVRAGESYTAQASTVQHIGIGERETVDRVTIRWPDGSEESVPGDRIRIDGITRIEQGGS